MKADIKNGDLLLFTWGCYDEYDLTGLYKATRNFNIDEQANAWKSSEKGKVRRKSFVAWLEHGLYLIELDFGEVNVNNWEVYPGGC